MPRYFFHAHDGELSHNDTDGTELADDGAARAEAIEALAEIAREALPRSGDSRDISIHVTDANGWPLFAARLDFHLDAVARP